MVKIKYSIGGDGFWIYINENSDFGDLLVKWIKYGKGMGRVIEKMVWRIVKK